jgi:c-di-GMP-binding flagellar brake protein YcgR
MQEESMWFDEEALKKAGTDLDGGAGNLKLRAGSDAANAVRLPLRIDDPMMVRSADNPTQMAKSKIVGAIHGDFIMITDPTVKVNDRLSVIIDGNLLCAYFHDGILYNFHSRFRRDLIHGTICIEYPKEIEARQVRKHRRIKVNIETKFAAFGYPNWLSADMADISKGGCRLILKSKIIMKKGMRLKKRLAEIEFRK